MAINLVKNEAGFKNSKFGIFANTNAIGLERALITAFAGADIEIIQAPRIEGIARPETFYSRVPESFEEGNDLSGSMGRKVSLFSNQPSIFSDPMAKLMNLNMYSPGYSGKRLCLWRCSGCFHPLFLRSVTS